MGSKLLRFQKYIVRQIIDTVDYDPEKDDYIINRISLTDKNLQTINEEGNRYGLTPEQCAQIISQVSNNIVLEPATAIHKSIYDVRKATFGQHLDICFDHPNKGPHHIEVVALNQGRYMVLSSTIRGLQLLDELEPVSLVWNPGFFIDFHVFREGKRYPGDQTKLSIGKFTHIKVYSPSVVHEILDSESDFSKPKSTAAHETQKPDSKPSQNDSVLEVRKNFLQEDVWIDLWKRYDGVSRVVCGDCVLVKRNDKYGFVDVTGSEVIGCKYDEAGDFTEGLAYVEMNEKYGFINSSAREVIPCKYDSVFDFSEGLAEFRLNGKYGFVDLSGHEVIPCKYDKVSAFSEGLARVSVRNKMGFIDKSGREVIPCKYDQVWDFSEGLAMLRVGKKDGFIDKHGNEVIACKYDQACHFSEGLALVKQNKKYGFITKTDKKAIPCRYDDARPFSEGYALVKSNGNLFYINKNGQKSIPCKYDAAWDFSEGLALVKLNAKYGFIDQTGREVVPCRYDDADFFVRGFAKVMLNEKYGFINKTGREIVPCHLDVADTLDGSELRVIYHGLSL